MMPIIGKRKIDGSLQSVTTCITPLMVHLKAIGSGLKERQRQQLILARKCVIDQVARPAAQPLRSYQEIKKEDELDMTDKNIYIKRWKGHFSLIEHLFSESFQLLGFYF